MPEGTDGKGGIEGVSPITHFWRRNQVCNQSLNSKSPKIIPMCEILERRLIDPYESDADLTDEEIVEGLMEITALSLTDVMADEPNYE